MDPYDLLLATVLGAVIVLCAGGMHSAARARKMALLSNLPHVPYLIPVLGSAITYGWDHVGFFMNSRWAAAHSIIVIGAI